MSNWYQRQRAKLGKLSEAERTYLARHPWHAADIEVSADTALSEAAKRFGRGSLHNGAGDAFRHCFWNALLARDIGQDNALQFTTAHENKPGNPPDEKYMDLHNNAVGARIGASNPNASDAVLASLRQEALVGGKLKVISP